MLSNFDAVARDTFKSLFFVVALRIVCWWSLTQKSDHHLLSKNREIWQTTWLRYQITKMSSEVFPEQFPLTQPSWEEAQGPTREARGRGAPPRDRPVPWAGRPLAEPSWHRLCCAAAWRSLGSVDWVLMCILWESTASLSYINRGPYPPSIYTNTWAILHLHSLVVVLLFIG